MIRTTGPTIGYLNMMHCQVSHAYGHNIIGTLVHFGIALKQVIDSRLKVIVLGCPAEEGGKR